MGRGSGVGAGISSGGVVATGYHAETISNEVGAAPRIVDRQMANILQRHPVADLQFVKNTVVPNAQGVYFHARDANFPGIRPGTLQVASVNPGTPLGTKLGPKTEVMQTTAKTPARAMQQVLTHELGHHVHEKVSAKDYVKINRLYKERMKTGNFVSQYARENVKEFFAESVTATKHHPREMKVFDKELHKEIKSILKNVARGKE